ncbi:MAG: hypothetical protein Q4F88_06765 [Eubacteriales bacterium]|nr:hypothetical protein [Eubacteriales bacterium]
MKKENYYKFMYAIAILLLIGFAIRLGADYFKYDSITSSAPFYVFILERALEFILPSIIIFIVGIVCKKKFAK